ncbi:MAG TPA: hypothetical protein VNN22_17360 [Verrucomicrobiae bacterium]|nr:hypothetical protein [Verrucomicrobiae bacterium]
MPRDIQPDPSLPGGSIAAGRKAVKHSRPVANAMAAAKGVVIHPLDSLADFTTGNRIFTVVQPFAAVTVCGVVDPTFNDDESLG